MSVGSILNAKGRNVATAASTDALSSIIGTLEEMGIGAIVICDNPKEVCGIISERDIVRAIARGGAAAIEAPVSEHMTANVKTVSDEDSIDTCMAMMTQGRFRHLPVVNNGKLDGIISIGDVVKARIAQAEQEAEALKSYITAG